MPTVLRIGKYRFFFYSNENNEPPHVHVKAAQCEAKFWLGVVELAFNHGYKSHELNEVERLVKEHQADLLEAWNEYFSREQF